MIQSAADESSMGQRRGWKPGHPGLRVLPTGHGVGDDARAGLWIEGFPGNGEGECGSLRWCRHRDHRGGSVQEDGVGEGSRSVVQVIPVTHVDNFRAVTLRQNPGLGCGVRFPGEAGRLVADAHPGHAAASIGGEEGEQYGSLRDVLPATLYDDAPCIRRSAVQIVGVGLDRGVVHPIVHGSGDDPSLGGTGRDVVNTRKRCRGQVVAWGASKGMGESGSMEPGQRVGGPALHLKGLSSTHCVRVI